MKAPRDGPIMDRPAAGLIAIVQNGKRLRGRVRTRAPGHRLALCVWTQILPLEVTQFVLTAEIRRAQARATLQANDFHSCFAKLGGEYSAYSAHTDDDDIRFFGCHNLYLRVYRPVTGARENACLLSRSVLVKIGCAPGKPTKRHPAKSLLPP